MPFDMSQKAAVVSFCSRRHETLIYETLSEHKGKQQVYGYMVTDALLGLGMLPSIGQL